jgi:hypothetical protein
LTIPNPPQPEPREIRAGDTLQSEHASDAYPPTEGYSLSYVFVNRTADYSIAGAIITVGHTAAWAAGR